MIYYLLLYLTKAHEKVFIPESNSLNIVYSSGEINICISNEITHRVVQNLHF